MPSPPPLPTILAATLSGDAIGNVTPLSLLASEPAKAMYLGRDAEGAQPFAALAAENFFYSVSVAIYVIAGTAAMLVAFGDRLPERVVTAGVAALLLMAGVLAGAGWLAWARPSVLSGAMARLPLPGVAGLIDRVKQFEVDAYGSAGGRASRVGVVAASDAVFHGLSFAEAWVTLWLLTGASAPLAAFILDTANRVVNVVFRMVPLRAGVDEATSETVSAAIGLATGVGVAMGLVRKARVVVWAAVGFALLARRLGSGRESET
jgi:hypothetical protein